MQKVELGGGTNPRGDGYINVDLVNKETVDVVCDLERQSLPFADDSVDAIYSAHTFEHIQYGKALREIARVCKVGATVEIIVPHWLSESAMCPGHKHTVSPEQIRQITETALDHYWHGCTKRLKYVSTTMRPSEHFEDIKAAFPYLTDEQILQYIPGACCEIHFVMEVVPHENAVPTPATDGNDALDVTILTVLYEPDWERTGNILRQSLEAAVACELKAELLIIDNSPEPTPHVVDWLKNAAADIPHRYVWTEGHNTYLAGAYNKAIDLMRGRTLVYVCASHGVMNDPTWLRDLLEPLDNEKCGMAGMVASCEFNRVAAVPEDIIEPQMHIQGGVWAARRDVLQKFRFSHRFPFEFVDVDFSRRLLAAGYELVNVESLASVAGGVIPNPEDYKYVHDYR